MSVDRVAGVDEAGRGALAGPVVSAAVIFRSESQIEGLTDSKRLSARSRSTLEKQIKNQCLCWAIGIATAQEIDQINILQASLLSMQRAIEALRIKPDKVLIDGNFIPDIKYPAQAMIKGDLHEPVISAASILAKVTRDSMMSYYAIAFPQYGFDRHAGYGTKYHLDALTQYGATAIHRNTFEPVRKRNQIL